jgi:hypothetical protein
MILLRILATVDATFAPFRAEARGPISNRMVDITSCSAAMQRQRAYLEGGGVPYFSSGTSAQRKETERLLGELESSGMLRLHGRSGRREGVSLTDFGDSVARWLAAMPMLCTAWETFEFLQALHEGSGCKGLIPEHWFIGQAPDDDPHLVAKVTEIEQRFAPFLCRGLVRGSSDNSGRAAYVITTEGREALAAGKPAMPAPLPTYVTGNSGKHDRLYAQALRERDSWEPEKTNWLWIPHIAAVDAKSWNYPDWL